MPKTQKRNLATVLIVDDETVLRKMIRKVLQRHGFNVIEAQNGKEGLNLALKEKPDLILLDVMMPEMDGITMLDKLRKTKAGIAIPVILLTQLEYDKKIEGAMKLGACSFLVKAHVEIEDIVNKIKQKLAI
jgi:DNA-binding response OmpR family regulator